MRVSGLLDPASAVTNKNINGHYLLHKASPVLRVLDVHKVSSDHVVIFASDEDHAFPVQLEAVHVEDVMYLIAYGNDRP